MNDPSPFPLNIIRYVLIYLFTHFRGWWISKCVELIMTATATKRLNLFRDTLLVNRLPTIDLIKILNNDRMLLARTNVQSRILDILNNEVINSENVEKKPILPETNEVKCELLNIISALDIMSVIEQVEHMNVSRLLSLIHAITGEYLTLLNRCENSTGAQEGGMTDDKDGPQPSAQAVKPVSQR